MPKVAIELPRTIRRHELKQIVPLAEITSVKVVENLGCSAESLKMKRLGGRDATVRRGHVGLAFVAGFCLRARRERGRVPLAVRGTGVRLAAYPATSRQAQAMLWARAYQRAAALTRPTPRTTKRVRPRLRAWAFTHSTVAARSL